jgi:hypothetical protein
MNVIKHVNKLCGQNSDYYNSRRGDIPAHIKYISVKVNKKRKHTVEQRHPG